MGNDMLQKDGRAGAILTLHREGYDAQAIVDELGIREEWVLAALARSGSPTVCRLCDEELREPTYSGLCGWCIEEAQA